MAEALTRVSGKLRFFKRVEGYGFIIRDDGQPDVFIHSDELRKSKLLWLDEGCKLTFEVVDEGRGPKAANLQAVR